MGPAGAKVLDEPTLVLNRSWVPINTVTVRQALRLVIKGSATIVQPETYEIHHFESWMTIVPTNGDMRIRSVGFAIRPPEVIVLSRYNRLPRQCVPFTRRNLYKRDEHRCQDDQRRRCVSAAATEGLRLGRPRSGRPVLRMSRHLPILEARMQQCNNL